MIEDVKGQGASWQTRKLSNMSHPEFLGTLCYFLALLGVMLVQRTSTKKFGMTHV